MLSNLKNKIKRIPFITTANIISYSSIVSFIAIAFSIYIYISEKDRLQTLFAEAMLLKINLLQVASYDDTNLFGIDNSKSIFKSFTKIDESMNELKYMYRYYNLSNSDLLKLSEVLGSYKNSFDEFVKYRTEITDNLSYSLKISKERAVVSLSNHNLNNLSEYILLLELDYTQFLQSKSTAYAEQFLKDYDNLEKKILANNINEDNKNNILLSINEYKNSFMSIVEAVTKLGVSYNTGIIGLMRENLALAVSHSNAIIVKIEKLKYQKEGIYGLYLILIIVFFSLFISTSMFLLSSKMKSDLLSLEKTAKDISSDSKIKTYHRFSSDGFSNLAYFLNKNLSIIDDSMKNIALNINEHRNLLKYLIGKNEILKIEDATSANHHSEDITYHNIIELNRESLETLYNAMDTHIPNIKKECDLFVTSEQITINHQTVHSIK